MASHSERKAAREPAPHEARPPTIRDRFNHAADSLTRRLGSPFALAGAAVIILIWAVTGPLFHFSDTWQLVINTGTTIVTFLMVFVIQSSQNRDSKAVHLKLDEIIRALDEARNDFVTVEQASEEEMKEREDEMALVAERVAHEAGHPEPRRIAEEAARSMARSTRRRSRPRKKADEKDAGAKR
jgi:low affinity Fe/Cu permease